MDHGHLDAAVGDRARGLQPEQAAADHHGAAGAVGAAADRADVVAGAERRRALDPFDRRQERARAGGEHQRVERDPLPVAVIGDAILDVDDLRRELDLVLEVPALRVQRQVGRRAVAGEVVAEPDAVVRQAALVGRERDAPALVIEHGRRRLDARGAGADDQQVLLGALAAALAERLDADRGGLQRGLAGDRVGLAVGEVVDAAVARGRVQQAPVKRGERGAGAQRRIEPDAQLHGALAGDDPREVTVLQPRAIGVVGVQLDERLGLVEDQLGRLAGAGHRVPLAGDPAGGEDQRVLVVGRVGGIAGLGGRQHGLAALGVEVPVEVEPQRARVRGRADRPLQRALRVQARVGTPD